MWFVTVQAATRRATSEEFDDDDSDRCKVSSIELPHNRNGESGGRAKATTSNFSFGQTDLSSRCSVSTLLVVAAIVWRKRKCSVYSCVRRISVSSDTPRTGGADGVARACQTKREQKNLAHR